MTKFLRLAALAAVSVMGALLLPAAHAGDAKLGEALVKKLACAACHGESMNKPIDPSYPKLAGQYEDYLYVALKSYKTEGNAIVGRNNASMVGFAKQLTNKEMKDIAAYISRMPGELKVAPEAKTRFGEK